MFANAGFRLIEGVALKLRLVQSSSHVGLRGLTSGHVAMVRGGGAMTLMRQDKPTDKPSVRPADFLTEQEFTAYTRLFSDMDKNKDGAISKDELKDGLRDFIGYEASESELNESMQVLDKNKDGKVDIKDFLEHMQARKSETRLEAIRFTFEMWDSDSDGFIDKNDLRSMLRAVGEEPSDEKINKILNTSDLDKDGRLSFQEFKDIFKDKQF
ncbi:calmodulin [Nilaparvata lugens]|uniref:calmodulin n=1 Tax=Nilaparvata lugens TaxID=108931 RepID=UPI000B97FAC6|nr:calmodulin [Nilaparvata lugens]